MVRIDKRIKAPQKGTGRPASLPWRELQIGNSFFAPGKSTATFRTTYWHRVTGHTYVTRSETLDDVEGVRVWRIAGPNDIGETL